MPLVPAGPSMETAESVSERAHKFHREQADSLAALVKMAQTLGLPPRK